MTKQLLLAALLLAGVVLPGVAAEAKPTNAAPSEVLVARNYVLSANDLVRVEVFREDDLRAERRIAADGTVSLPLIGVVSIAGKNVEEAQRIIRDALEKDYLVNPRVTLTVLEQVKKRFTVIGQVNKTGVIEIPPDQTINLLDGIAMAGGPTSKGTMRRVTVMRATGQVHEINAEAMMRNPKLPRFEILPNDTIHVGESVF